MLEEDDAMEIEGDNTSPKVCHVACSTLNDYFTRMCIS